TFNCLFCQNASHKFFSRINMISVDDVAERIFKNPKITCICYFGGTPEAQLPFTINLSQKIIDKISREGQNRKFRVCWEWNGTGDPKLVEKCMEIAIKTGGNIKFDLKTFNERLNIALCGVSNSRTLSNFEFLAKKFFNLRRDPPVLGATTLLVSGYVNHKEVELISKFISSINPDIPYSLLVFHPDYQMKDLPITPKNEALKCLSVAKKYLKNVNLGNKFLLNIF
ncbi:MAG: radical SAM protein, partial [Promethearchaeota archaeon]